MGVEGVLSSYLQKEGVGWVARCGGLSTQARCGGWKSCAQGAIGSPGEGQSGGGKNWLMVFCDSDH
jgi:hypothetical protein